MWCEENGRDNRNVAEGAISGTRFVPTSSRSVIATGVDEGYQ